MNTEETTKRLYTEAEAARYLGMTLPAIREKRYKGEGPVPVRWDRKIRYDRGDLDAFVEAHKQKTPKDNGGEEG